MAEIRNDDAQTTSSSKRSGTVAPLRSSQLDALGTLAHAASTGGEPAECAPDMLDCLRQLIPYECAELTDYDPVSLAPRLLANSGYSDDLITHMHGDLWWESGNQLGVRRTGHPLLMREVPPDSLAECIVRDVLRPAGFAGGMTMFLVTGDGRCVGMLNLSTTHGQHPTDAERSVMSCLNRALANAVDPLRSISTLVGLLDQTAAAVLVTRNLTAVALPGRPTITCLESGSPLVAATVKRLAARARTASFLWRDAEHGWLKVNSFVVSGDSAHGEQRIVISAGAIVPPYQLTARELEVVSLLASGYSNTEIAALLVVSRRTVSTHVEHVLEKLGVSNRAAAAHRATSEGFLLGCVAGVIPITSV